jgi:hypothetical protein
VESTIEVGWRGLVGLRCFDGKKQFTVKAGTIDKDTPLGMERWMMRFGFLPTAKT